MNCAQVQHHLDGWVRGEVEGSTGDALAAHVASCPVCAAEADLARRIAGGLRGLRTTASSALVGRILETAPRRAPSRRIAWFTPFRALAALFLVAAVVVFSRDRGDLLTPMNPEVVAPPAPLFQDAPSAAVPSEPTPGASAFADGAGYAVTPEEAVPAGEARVPAVASRPAAPRAALRSRPVASIPAPVSAAPAPVSAAPAPPPVTASKAFSAPSAAEAAASPYTEPAPVYERSTTSAAGLPATGTYQAAGTATGTARLTSMTTSFEPSGGSATAGGVSLAYAEVSVPSRVPEERSAGTKLFLRSLSGDGNGGMTTFTQAHQLRPVARTPFRDTTAPTLIYSIPRR